MNAVPLFGPVQVSSMDFHAMEPHVQTEAALLFRESLLALPATRRRKAFALVQAMDVVRDGSLRSALRLRHAYRLPGTPDDGAQLENGRVYADAAGKNALSRTAGRVLGWLCTKDGMRAEVFVKDIANALDQPASTIQNALQRLHALGLIDFHARRHGRRPPGYQVTKAGEGAAVAGGHCTHGAIG